MKSILALALLLLASCAVPVGSRIEEPDSSGLALQDEGDDPSMRGFSVPGYREKSVAMSAPAIAEVAMPDAPVDQRQVIYSAFLRLVVTSAREAHVSIVGLAKEAGGHMQESDSHSVTVRVPAARFEAVMKSIEGLGEVADSNVRASDVTEEMLDIDIRLENARKSRQRLLAHLEKSEKVEDTLKIEAELARVTEEIERMEGRLRYLRSQIAMSTIRVELNTNQPQRPGNEVDLPFAWITRLGDGLVAGTVQGKPRQPGWFSRGPSFEPPPAFVRYYRKDDLVEAMNAEGVRIKVQAHDNFDSGVLAFWSQLARNTLVQRRSLSVTEERALDKDRALLAGTREIGQEALGYLLVLVRTKDEVHTFEAWGPKDLFEPLKPALIRSAESLSP